MLTLNIDNFFNLIPAYFEQCHEISLDIYPKNARNSVEKLTFEISIELDLIHV